jgi:hypothetical protein
MNTKLGNGREGHRGKAEPMKGVREDRAEK